MSIAEALNQVGKNVQSLSLQYGMIRPARLVAVSKTKPASAIRAAYDAGQRHFGENYVQELVEKAPELPADIQWHFIGHLQSNKAKQIAKIPNIFLVESIDNEKLASTLNKAVPEERTEPLRVLVQVNTSGEETKSGIEPDGCVDLVNFILENCSRLRFSGLMTIGRLGDISPECFDLLAKCKEDVLKSCKVDYLKDDFELSMGMSSDYDIAIRAGSTNVRIGSTIFGERDYSAKTK